MTQRTIRALLLLFPLLLCGCASSALLVPDTQIADLGRKITTEMKVESR